jgi:hypothetical protein
MDIRNLKMPISGPDIYLASPQLDLIAMMEGKNLSMIQHYSNGEYGHPIGTSVTSRTRSCGPSRTVHGTTLVPTCLIDGPSPDG